MLEIKAPNKSAIKHQSTLGGLIQYTVPNTKYTTGDESPPPPPPPPPPKKKKKNLFTLVKFFYKLTPHKNEYGEWHEN